MHMDEMLMAELKKFNLEFLYDKFCNAKITSDIIWILDEEMLEDIDLTKIEQLKYKQALETLKHTSWLMGELKRCTCEYLYDKFHQAAWITIDNIWTLDEGMLHSIGLTKSEQLTYQKAAKKFIQHGLDNDMPQKDSSWLMGELKRYNLEFLYDKFHQAGGIGEDNIWTLDDDLLKRIGLTKIEQFRYKKALEKFKQHGSNDDMLQKDALTKIELLKLLNSTTKVSQGMSI